ncbi:FAD-dependent monooxygenase [Merismopedia glauca]|uniref:Monooxygenase n=1 Tax=Merismopedia glauca CCAP 1448/3 TaxID=1296344 RepID=A0A2T1BXQ8_9CYAN|nr:FAD-dependent monooxygenase [Merismopedia glauca]PSB00799.1 monooxygenase [Merismopedia glauca CCAP 1448/3]
MTQVVIVGAGPTGVTLALLLVKQGIKVKLVEASRNFRRIFRGEALMPSGLDALDQMGLSSVIERIPHRPLDAWEFIINGKTLFQVEEPMETGGKPCTLVSQPALLQELVAEAMTYPEFKLISGNPVQDLLKSQGRICAVHLGDGTNIPADLVIGTDGRNSVVRERANLQLKEQGQSFDVLWFKLADSPLFDSKNVFYTIVKGKSAFGLFRSSEGNLQLGWTLHPEEAFDWKQANWSEILANAAPDRLAGYFRDLGDTIERPILLSVKVGLAHKWYAPGVLILGDAAHPMSPIRAQGINVALRDAIAAANHLIPVLLQGVEVSQIDAVLARIQTEREPEIIKIQKLQSQEVLQAEILRKIPLLQRVLSQLTPIVSPAIRKSWLSRQRQLRHGVTKVKLDI